MAPKNHFHNKQKSVVLPIFIKPYELPSEDGRVYGLEIKRAIEVVLGPDRKIECVQKCNGFWRIILWSVQDRNTLLQAGLTIRGLVIPLYGSNPNNINGKESVRLYISNVYYSIADEEVKKALRGIGLVLGGEIKYENYKDENRKTLETKTGRRFVMIAEPTSPLPDYVRIAGLTNGFLTILRFKDQNNDNSDRETGKLQGSESFSDIVAQSKASGLAAAKAFLGPNDKTRVNGEVSQAKSDINSDSDLNADSELNAEKAQVAPTVDESVCLVNSEEDTLGLTNPFSSLSGLEESVVVAPPVSKETPENTTFPVFDLNRGRVASRKLPVPGSRHRSGTRSPSLSNARSTSVSSMKRKGKGNKVSTPKKQKKEELGLYTNIIGGFLPTVRSTSMREQNLFKSFDQTGFDWFEYSFS